MDSFGEEVGVRIEHVEEFLDLAVTLNFTRTAKHFYITQPVLSKHIAGLEAELGSRLFNRDKTGITLTSFGTALLPMARALVGDKNRLLDEARSLLSNNGANMRIGYLQGAAGAHIPEIQRRFKIAYPNVSVEYFTYEFDKIFEQLNNSSVDLIIGGLTLSLENNTYVIHKVYEDTYFALTKADDPLASLREISASDLAGKTVVVPAPSFFSRDIEALEDWLHADENGIRIVDSVHDINAAPLSVKIDNAVSLTFGHLAPFYGSEYELVPLKSFDKTLDIAVIWRRSMEKPFFNHFANTVQEVIEEFGY